MKALWFENKKLQLRTDISVPSPGEGEVLIRVKCTGICSTDLELLKGYYSFQGIPGHEFVGIVEQGPDAWVGKRVVGEINIACGHCADCQEGRRKHCSHRKVLGIRDYQGAFAEYIVLPLSNILEVPDALSDEEAVFVEPLAAALQIQQQITIAPTDKVVVVGAGRLGQLIAQTLTLSTPHLLVVAKSNSKLHHLGKMGISTATTEELLMQHSFDIAVDCSGHPLGFELARKSLRPMGTLVMKSTYAENLNIDASSIVVDEIRLVGSRCGPFDKALALLFEKRVCVDYLHQQTFSLQEGVEAFRCASQPETLKVLVKQS